MTNTITETQRSLRPQPKKTTKTRRKHFGHGFSRINTDEMARTFAAPKGTPAALRRVEVFAQRSLTNADERESEPRLSAFVCGLL
jgi:hypothetical protein